MFFVFVGVVVNCSAPDVSTGSTVSGNTFTYNSTVDYTCALGYNTVGGSATRRCLDSGAWSGSALQCQSKLAIHCAGFFLFYLSCSDVEKFQSEEFLVPKTYHESDKFLF